MQPNKSPIVITDSQELGQKRLDALDNLQKLKEENIRMAAKFKLPGQAMLENAEIAVGKPMAWQDLVRLLQKMNPDIKCVDGGMANAIAVRFPAMQEDGVFGLKYVTGFYKEVLPEFSHISTDIHGLAVRENRGWRTVVLACIRQGIVSYRDAVDVFGEPDGVRGGRWHEILREQKG
jgi:hypothetical protein